MIRLSDLHLTFNPNTPIANPVFSGFNLEIPTGQFITVIGSNGAGKSTLLNLISGDLRPDSGDVTIGDTRITHWDTARRAKLVARVFQNPLAGSCANLTLEENLALAAQRGKSRHLIPALSKSFRQGCKIWLAQLGLGLENRLGDRMGLLSGGQRQAVSLLMSTLAPNQVLLLDEHTAALDPKTATDILHLTTQIVRDRSLTTLMVTHSMKQALQHGDRTIMLHEGKIILDLVGSARSGITVQDLLQQFEQRSGDELADDSLLLG
jgi:putative tryptophan/tyrosine transport system ATP-binding protein